MTHTQATRRQQKRAPLRDPDRDGLLRDVAAANSQQMQIDTGTRRCLLQNLPRVRQGGDAKPADPDEDIALTHPDSISVTASTYVSDIKPGFGA